jgi:phosphatidylethanolamine-binding protein (PEBP) family uncharacterized protein
VARLAALAVVIGLAAACGPDDGRELADPDPDLTAVPVPTTSPAAIVDVDPDLQTTGPGGLTLTSPDFSPGSTMPAASGCGGATSPALAWTAPPPRTRQLALVVQDVDTDGTVHWLVTDIPVASRRVDRGTPPVGGTVHMNSRGTATWASPCPQDGFAHRIVFFLYVLDRALPPTTDDAASVVAAIRETAFGSATLLGRAEPGVPPG